LDAIWFSDRVGFFLRSRVSGCFCPVVKGHGANVYAYAVSSAKVPVYGNVGSVYSQLLGWFYWSPDFVSVVFAYNFSVLLKIRVYRQKLSPLLVQAKREILGFLLHYTIELSYATSQVTNEGHVIIIFKTLEKWSGESCLSL